MSVPDEIPAISIEEHLKITISKKNINTGNVISKITIRKRL